MNKFVLHCFKFVFEQICLHFYFVIKKILFVNINAQMTRLVRGPMVTCQSGHCIYLLTVRCNTFVFFVCFKYFRFCFDLFC